MVIGATEEGPDLKKILFMSMLAIVLMASPAFAERGFYFGLNLLFNDISGDVNSADVYDSGSGLGLRGGFGLNRYLALEAGVWQTRHDLKVGGGSADLQAGTFDLKINVPISGSHIEPYVLAGVGTYSLEQNGSSDDGEGVRFGLGMDISLFQELSFNVGLTRNNVTFKHAGRETDGKITTMDFGLSYHFL
jgi:hypothetical protein